MPRYLCSIRAILRFVYFILFAKRAGINAGSFFLDIILGFILHGESDVCFSAAFALLEKLLGHFLTRPLKLGLRDVANGCVFCLLFYSEAFLLGPTIAQAVSNRGALFPCFALLGAVYPNPRREPRMSEPLFSGVSFFVSVTVLCLLYCFLLGFRLFISVQKGATLSFNFSSIVAQLLTVRLPLDLSESSTCWFTAIGPSV